MEGGYNFRRFIDNRGLAQVVDIATENAYSELVVGNKTLFGNG